MAKRNRWDSDSDSGDERVSRRKQKNKFPLAATFSGSGCSLSKAGFDLLSRMLALSPRKRISAKEALAHEYFQESPPPKQQELMPTFPA
ncbi:Protein kinase-like domain [Phytophthora cactorum]|nr:Protein kinase-like domain [Phytophthora cactorum]